MRYLLPLLVASMTVSACRCGPDVATPVTFQLQNPLGVPIYVDETDGRMGMKVKRQVGSEWLPFVESPPCECLSCDQVCNGPCECALEPASSQVMKIAEGGLAERVWSGVVQISSNASCPDTLVQGPSCLMPENPSLDETFRLELCYALGALGAEDADAGVAVPGNLSEKSILCVEKPFTVRDGVVQISPQRGAACTEHSQCTGAEELCFVGACTTACPAAGFPRLGASWQVRIPEPDNQGFFAVAQEQDVERWSGTGTVGSVRYDNNTMTLRMSRPGPSGGALTGTLYATLPEGVSVPIHVGETLSVSLLDRSSDENPDNRGVVIRDAAGGLLLAAETAQKGRVLQETELAPFTVARVPGPVGCEHTDCGKNLFEKARFEAGGQSVALSPGTSEEFVASAQVWRVANVASERYASTWCRLDDLMPYVIANQRAGMGP